MVGKLVKLEEGDRLCVLLLGSSDGANNGSFIEVQPLSTLSIAELGGGGDGPGGPAGPQVLGEHQNQVLLNYH